MKLIETLGYHPAEGLRRLDKHLARMGSSAGALGFPFDETTARAVVDVTGDTPLRCRLTLDRDGVFLFETTEMAPGPVSWRVEIAPERLNSSDPLLRHKTTRRETYDRMRAGLPPDIDERILLNEHGQVCDGTITSVFADLGDGLVTPPLSDGLLPGILRQEMLDAGDVRQAQLEPSDLRNARSLLVGNSLRGLIAAKLVS